MATATKPTRKENKMSKKRKLEDMTMDEFLNQSDSDDVSSSSTDGKEKKIKTAPTSTSSSVKTKKKKSSLKDLKDTDPEFYKFLLKEDKELLEDDDDDEDDDDEDEDLDSDDSDDDDNTGDRFQPPNKLEVASDDDDDEEDEDGGSDGEKSKPTKKRNLISAPMVKSWVKKMQESPSAEQLQHWTQVVAAAAQHAGVSVETNTPYRVEGNEVFNAILQTCVVEIVPFLEKVLTLKSLSDQQQVFSKKNKKWRAIKGSMKTYCTLLLQLSAEFTEAKMVNVLLRHTHKLVVCFSVYPKLSKVFLKKMVKLWGSGEETTRVLAFLCINKMVRLQPDTCLEPMLKQMYMAYVNNSKFVSPTSLPLINFMQRSLVEIFLVRENVAYQHAFVYIRQLAIHLRNAITMKKKESCQLVYNWQFVHSLGLWTQLLATSHPSPVLQPLIYPLVQVIIGTIRLQGTAKYYPLRFHCVRYLTTLSAHTFIPVLPFILEVLEQTDFNKRQKGAGMKDINMATILKLSKPQLQEKAFKESVIDQLCEVLWDYLHTQCHTAAFPELIVPLVIQLKDFLKKCKVTVLCKQVKQVVDKAEENARIIETRRRSATFNLTDTKAMELWESKNKEEGTPLSKFYASWRKMQDHQRQKQIALKDQMVTKGESQVRELSRPVKKTAPKASAQDREEFGQLFENDDGDDDDDDTFRFLPKSVKDQQRQSTQQLDSDEEDYSDFDSDDLEQLAHSASEEDDSEDEEEEEKEEKKKKTQNKQEKPKVEKKKKLVEKPTKKRKFDEEKEDADAEELEEFTMSDSD